MDRRWLWWLALPLAAIAVAIVAPFARSGVQSTGGPGSLIGQRETVVPLVDDRGAQASLAQYRGRVVVLNLWASWCPPCRAEMPELQQFYQRNVARGIVVIGVNQGESSERAAEFARSLDITFPIWIDEGQQYGRIYAALGLPTTIVFDRNGTVVRGFDGPITLTDLTSAVRRISAR